MIKNSIRRISKAITPTNVILICAVLSYFIIDYFIDLPPQGLIFQSEIVTAKSFDNKFQIEGVYHFLSKHRFKRSYTLGFPIYEKNGMPAPEQVEVIANGKKLTPKILSQGFDFTIPAEYNKTTTLLVRYILPAFAKKGMYITRTANLWSTPISEASFIIQPGMKSNYHTQNQTKVTFKKFHPKENWKFEWE